MAVKIYSDVTKKFYEDEAAALKAEEELKKAKDAEANRRKELAEFVDAKRKTYELAKKEYNEALEKFCKDYGSYHFTVTDKDLEDFFSTWFRW